MTHLTDKEAKLLAAIMKKFKKARTLAEAYRDPRVESYSDERMGDPEGGDGIWLYLRRPYYNPYKQSTCIHEWNVKDLLSVLNNEIQENEPYWVSVS